VRWGWPPHPTTGGQGPWASEEASSSSQLGAILRFAINADIEGVSLDVIGNILMVAGIAVAVLSLFFVTVYRDRGVAEASASSSGARPAPTPTSDPHDLTVTPQRAPPSGGARSRRRPIPAPAGPLVAWSAMPSKRDPHRQRRQARNRAERQAREARRAAAQAAASPTSSTTPRRRRRWGGGRSAQQAAPAEAGPAQSSAASSGTGGAARPARPGGGSFAGKPPGSRAAFLSLLFAVGALASVIFLQVPVDEDGSPLSQSEVEELDERREAGEDIPERERNAFSALWPLSILYVLPLGVGGIAVRATTRAARPGRVWMRSLIAITVFAIVSGIPILYFPMVLALAVASFQARRAEASSAAASRPEAPAGAASDDVIDVDAVEEPDRAPERRHRETTHDRPRSGATATGARRVGGERR
jgi:hypothetical protein